MPVPTAPHPPDPAWSLCDPGNHLLSLPRAGIKGSHHHIQISSSVCPSPSLSALPDTFFELLPRSLSPVPSHTFFKDIERDLRSLAHYVWWVFDITGESAVVAVVKVVYDNGAVLPARVPYPLDALFEGPHFVNVRLSFGIVEDLRGTREIV